MQEKSGKNHELFEPVIKSFRLNMTHMLCFCDILRWPALYILQRRWIRFCFIVPIQLCRFV